MWRSALRLLGLSNANLGDMALVTIDLISRYCGMQVQKERECFGRYFDFIRDLD